MIKKQISKTKKKVGDPGYVNQTCWLASNLNYPPSKRCQYCETKFSNCLFERFFITSLVLISVVLVFTYLMEKTISTPIIVSLFIIIIVYGVFFDKSTERIIKANFAEKQAKQDFKKLSKTLQQKVEKQTKNIIDKNVHLEKLLEMRSKFLDTTSHQLRTPVSVMKGVLEMINTGEIDNIDPKQRKILMEGVFQKAKKLEQIISDILDATEIDTSHFVLSSSLSQDLQLEELINNVVQSHQLDVKTGNITLEYQKPKKLLPKIKGSRKHLEQVFNNLLDNAIKYTPTLNTQTGEKGKVSISIAKVENSVVIEISDNGIGVPEKEINGLFEKFVRASNAKEMYTDGTGLGLYIVKEIIAGHSGKIDIESNLGKGSTFTVHLPIQNK
jgi:signal transduction histidine kinase